MVKTTSEPIRTCVGCRERRPTSQLLRLRLTDEALTTDVSATGRGAWLCRSTLPQCIEAARSSHAFDRAFRGRIRSDIVAEFAERMSPGGDGGRLGNRR